MRIVVTHSDAIRATPPDGYAGIARIAWATACEFANLGARVRLFAPRLAADASVYAAIEEVVEGWPREGALREADAVYVMDADAMVRSGDALRGYRGGPIVLEENAPWLWPPQGGPLFHVVYRADRLPHYPAGRAWLCDQVVSRDEVGPPGPPEGYVLWMGRIHAEKGIESLLTFAYALPQVPIVVAGPEQTRRHRWPPNVQLVGEVSGEAKRKLFVGADALLYTVSAMWTGAGEGVLTEAIACGIPVLAQTFSRGTPATRLVIDGWNGFTHPDAGALARLYPHALDLDRGAIHRHAWARLAPEVVAADRLRRIAEARHSLGLSAV